jgi:hypothetical protein
MTAVGVLGTGMVWMLVSQARGWDSRFNWAINSA